MICDWNERVSACLGETVPVSVHVCVVVRDGCVLATLDPVLSAFFVTSGELSRQDNRKLSKGKLPKNVEMRREKKKERLFRQQPRIERQS